MSGWTLQSKVKDAKEYQDACRMGMLEKSAVGEHA
jgi:hypothetical protein